MQETVSATQNLEYVRLRPAPGCASQFEIGVQRGADVLSTVPGCQGVLLSAADHDYVLIIAWQNAAMDGAGFRASPAYQEWRGCIAPHLESATAPEYLRTVVASGNVRTLAPLPVSADGSGPGRANENAQAPLDV